MYAARKTVNIEWGMCMCMEKLRQKKARASAHTITCETMRYTRDIKVNSIWNSRAHTSAPDEKLLFFVLTCMAMKSGRSAQPFASHDDRTRTKRRGNCGTQVYRFNGERYAVMREIKRADCAENNKQKATGAPTKKWTILRAYRRSCSPAKFYKGNGECLAVWICEENYIHTQKWISIFGLSQEHLCVAAMFVGKEHATLNGHPEWHTAHGHWSGQQSVCRCFFLKWSECHVISLRLICCWHCP